MDKLDLQFRLRRKGFTQADVARMAGVSEAAVSMVLSGRSRSRRIESLISGLLGTVVEDLFPVALESTYQLNPISATAKTR